MYNKAAFILLSFSLTIASSLGLASDFDGVWASEGYGYLFHIDSSQVAIYEQTQISCLPSSLSPGKLSLNTNNRSGQFQVTIPGFINATMHVAEGNHSKHRVFHRSDTNTFIDAYQIDSLPQECKQVADSGADNTLKVFKQTFKEHYPFFKHSNPNWVENRTEESAEKLFQQLQALVQPLADPHIALVAADIEGYYFGNEAALPPAAESIASTQVVLAKYLNNTEPQSYCRDNIIFAQLNNEIAYLAIHSFTDYSNSGEFQDEVTALHTSVDKIFSGKPFEQLIIDLRHNRGGSDKLAIELARRLTKQPYTAYRKQARLTNNKQWSKAKATQVEPSIKPKYVGNITLLTSGATVSAGETFTMALMERKPKVTRIGQATRGSFSDMLPRILPNGWLFALPNERYLDSADESFDFVGIKPHIKVEVTPGEDRSLNLAIEEANKASQKGI